MLQAVWVITVATIGGTAGGLGIGRAPRLGAESTEQSSGVEGARSNLHVVRLLYGATLFCPVSAEFKDDILEVHGILLFDFRGKFTAFQKALNIAENLTFVYGELPV